MFFFILFAVNELITVRTRIFFLIDEDSDDKINFKQSRLN